MKDFKEEKNFLVMFNLLSFKKIIMEFYRSKKKYEEVREINNKRETINL